ncbi:bifunctional ligase/repressor BirA [bacterium BMS3Abin06]|nr:bifunctional ligase/repressor BirA [bacterium BMS3Abin06]
MTKFAEKAGSIFKGGIIGREIIFFESVPSTNDKAFEIGQQKENPEGIVVIADSQTCGKGRLGRRWISPPGVNLYFTVLLKPPFPLKESFILALAAAVAATTAIRKYTGLDARIKWPNDILINNRKSCGILTEMKSGKDRINLMAVGIGVNVNMLPDAFTDDIKPFTTSLKIESGLSFERDKLLREILAELEKAYKNLLTGNKRALINDWLRLNCTIGNEISVQSRTGIISGIAAGINDNGELLVRPSSGEIERVSAGDVTILKN